MHIEKEDLYNERIINKLKLRKSKINIILASKRIKNEIEIDKVKEIENKNKPLESILIPDDFQIQVHKFYENVIFL